MFKGFTQNTVDFMWGIRFNNEREWFLAHKEAYQQDFLAPVRELGEQVYDGLRAASASLAKPGSICSTYQRTQYAALGSEKRSMSIVSSRNLKR